MNPLVSVVVVNWNGRRYLEECLAALLVQTYSPFEIVLVDNGSTDDSVPFVRERFPQVRLVLLERNTGFAAGHNRGIAASRGVYVATLNNDAIPEPGWLGALVAAAERDPQVGMVASKMLFYDRPTVVNSAGICVDRAGIAWDRHGGWPDDPNEPSVEVFGPCAGAALYRRGLLDEVGLFDESFFCYLEDVDLAWRARLAGWRCWYAPDARVLHHHSGTAGDASAFKRYHLGRNKVWLIAKNYPMPELLTHLPLIVAYDLLAVVGMLLTGHRHGYAPSARLASLTGRLVGLAGLPRALAARRRILARARRQVFRHLEPLALPWDVPQRWAHLKVANHIG